MSRILGTTKLSCGLLKNGHYRDYEDMINGSFNDRAGRFAMDRDSLEMRWKILHLWNRKMILKDRVVDPEYEDEDDEDDFKI